MKHHFRAKPPSPVLNVKADDKGACCPQGRSVLRTHLRIRRYSSFQGRYAATWPISLTCLGQVMLTYLAKRSPHTSLCCFLVDVE